MLIPGKLGFLIFTLCFLCFGLSLKASSSIERMHLLTDTEKLLFGTNDNFSYNTLLQSSPPEFISKLIKNKTPKNKKLIAALLAFPFPFGIVGLHRIYLGTAPHVPVVYIGTIGGGFGLIPLIDFFAILFEKDIEHFIGNKKVFMWVN